MSGRQLIVNSVSLIGTTVVTSGLGAVYWWVAATNFSAASVGVGSALISAMGLIATLSTLGLGTLLIGELPSRRSEGPALIGTAISVSIAAGMFLGVLFALGAPLFATNLESVLNTPPHVALFAAGVGLASAALVLDQALIGLFKGHVQFQRNVVFSVTKLLAIALIGASIVDAGSEMIYVAWIVGILVSVLIVAGLAIVRLEHLSAAIPRWRLVVDHALPALGHHGFNLAVKAPQLIMPVLAISLLSAEATGSLYIASMIALFLWMVPISLSTVLFAVGVGNILELAPRLRTTLTMSFAVTAVGIIVVVVAASPILELFGVHYAEQATWALRILILATLPMIIKTHFVAVSRVRRRVGKVMPYVWLGTLGEVTLAAIGAEIDGLNGLVVGWTIGMTLEAIAMLPTVVAAGQLDAVAAQQDSE